MSSNIKTKEEQNPVINLTMKPVRSILKTSKSTDDGRSDNNSEMISSLNNYPITGMTRSESKSSHKIPHFDEMNIIATYHPIDKDYGHMKIEEPKTPYAPVDNNIDEEMDTESNNNDETMSSSLDPDALAQRLHESSSSSRLHISRRSIDENAIVSPEELEHRKQFESHRKQHYNEFEVVRLRKKEIEAELRALEQEETTSSSNDSSHHQTHAEDDHQHDSEEREQKKHYDEFRVAHLPNKEDEK